MPKISVIVPIYNSENYLNRCIDSILKQSFKDFEIILVNDGSTDNSCNICSNYALYDSRIRLINQINQGVSYARNKGLNNASGTYVIHVDSDDFIEENMLADMYNMTENGKIDIVISDYFVDYQDKSKIVHQDNYEKTEDVIRGILSGKIHGSVCNKLIRREIYANNNIQFNTSLTLCEDMLFNIEYLLHASSVKFTNKAYLHYVQRNDSAVHVWDDTKFNSYFLLISKLNQVLKDKSFNEAISFFKIQIKKDLLVHGNLNYKDYIVIYPEIRNNILRHPSLNIKSKLAILLSFYKISYKIIKCLNG